MRFTSLITAACLLALAGCSRSVDTPPPINKNPYPSTYQPLPQQDLLITHATLLTGTGVRLEDADVYVRDGKVSEIGQGLNKEGVAVVDASGQWLTPGIIDVHSHLGAYPTPAVDAHQDGNEITGPNTAMVWVEHSVWPQDPGFNTARAGGITTLQILPGSANLFGGRGVTLKNVPATTMQGMKFPGAPYSLKMACGENPKRVYGGRQQAPGSRMGNMAGYRQAWADAATYRTAWHNFENGTEAQPPERNLQLDTLMGVLDGEILIQNHCYKAEEMAMMIDLGKEFGYHAGTFHHAVEAYKVADLLAENHNCAAMWPDWWGFKMEAYDMSFENVAMVAAAKGGCAIVHSDSERTIQRLNQEAGKILYRANANGFAFTEADAIGWITLNAAKAMGIDQYTGSIETGKNADLVLWNQNPFSVYALAQQVFIDGAKVYDRNDPEYQPVSDFKLGQEGL
ncbi:amidohydrolase [Halioxenophilus sp. WMMB6]|uniref:amidohydrolase n=1 Tax=Halioxenophilus sp. WMMB6 TaxID=3073815 RepID=UPI00295E9562|nr:amidohydrolase [Halioxenophilus sp. WMMB6]